MAEERETTQIETPEETASSLPIMPAVGHLALAMGMQGAADSPDLAKRTGDLLAKQSAMLDVQMEDLHEQRILQISHLRLRRWGEWLSLILRGLSVAGGVALAIGFAVIVWQAHKSTALIISPFAVPPDLAATGLTGDVVANRLLDRLAELQDQTDSARAPDTFRNAGEDDIRVEIPETGVSLGELLKLLHGWLGHETHITGDVVRMNGAITVTSRVGETPGRSFTGDGSKLDDLIKQAAETVYARTQPYRYGVYLSRNGRNAEALTVMKDLALKGPESERAWGYIGWAFVESDVQKSLELLRLGLEKNPNLASGWVGLAELESNLGRDEPSLTANRKAEYLLEKTPKASGVSPTAMHPTRLTAAAYLAEAEGNYGEGARNWQNISESGAYNSYNLEAGARSAVDAALNHDLSFLDEPRRWESVDSTQSGFLLKARAVIARSTATGNWSGVASVLDSLEAQSRLSRQSSYTGLVWPTQVQPWKAYAIARDGDFESARQMLMNTPVDCYNCLRVRGLIESLSAHPVDARKWLERATLIAPSLPFAYRDLAELAMAGGDLPAARAMSIRSRELGASWVDGLVTAARIEAKAGRCLESRTLYRKAAALSGVDLRTTAPLPSC